MGKVMFFVCLASCLIFDAVSAEIALEVSLGKNSDNLYSRLGVLSTGGTIAWVNKVKVGEKGHSPCVSVDGKTVVLVYVSKDKDLLYQVGSIDFETMMVSWGPKASYGKGRSPGIAVLGDRILSVPV